MITQKTICLKLDKTLCSELQQLSNITGIGEQFDSLIEQIDDCEPLDYYYLYDDISEYNHEIAEQLQDIENDLPF